MRYTKQELDDMVKELHDDGSYIYSYQVLGIAFHRLLLEIIDITITEFNKIKNRLNKLAKK